jgi:hypothetical protein
VNKYTLAALLVIALMMSSVWAADAKGEPNSKAEEKALPLFKPGAEVALALTVKAPKHWVLNYMVPLRVSFDEEKLKKAPFTVKQSDWDFEFEEYVGEYVASVPVKLKQNLPDGEIKIPLMVQCSICTDSGDLCSFAAENASVVVQVLAKAPEGAKQQPVAKGEMPAAVKLVPPE